MVKVIYRFQDSKVIDFRFPDVTGANVFLGILDEDNNLKILLISKKVQSYKKRIL
jgi:hypothetical protein